MFTKSLAGGQIMTLEISINHLAGGDFEGFGEVAVVGGSIEERIAFGLGDRHDPVVAGRNAAE